MSPVAEDPFRGESSVEQAGADDGRPPHDADGILAWLDDADDADERRARAEAVLAAELERVPSKRRSTVHEALRETLGREPW